jgi:hypothetical protein
MTFGSSVKEAIARQGLADRSEVDAGQCTVLATRGQVYAHVSSHTDTCQGLQYALTQSRLYRVEQPYFSININVDAGLRSEQGQGLG